MALQRVNTTAHRVALVTNRSIAIDTNGRIAFIIGTGGAFADVLTCIPPGHAPGGAIGDIFLRAGAVTIGHSIQFAAEIVAHAGIEGNLPGLCVAIFQDR